MKVFSIILIISAVTVAASVKTSESDFFNKPKVFFYCMELGVNYLCAADLETGYEWGMRVFNDIPSYIVLAYDPGRRIFIIAGAEHYAAPWPSYACIYRLDYDVMGRDVELLFKGEVKPPASFSATYDEAEGVFYVAWAYKDDYRGDITRVYRYDPETDEGVFFAEPNVTLWLTGGSFDGNPYVQYVDYRPGEDRRSDFFGYIDKNDKEVRDLGFYLPEERYWSTHNVSEPPYEKADKPIYYWAGKDTGGISSLSQETVFVRDPKALSEYRSVTLTAPQTPILYSPSTDALVYLTYVEGEYWEPKIVVRPVDGSPGKMFILPDQAPPGYKGHEPRYSLLFAE